MFLAKVVGCVWATVKDPKLEGQRMLIIQPVTPELTPTGKQLIVLDSVGAGAGELVYCCKGKESSFPFLPSEVTTDTSIVGIVDELHVRRPPKEAEC